MRRLARPATFLLSSLLAVVAFRYARHAIDHPIGWGDLGGWLDRTDPTDALAEIACLLGLILAGYVAVVAALALLGELAGLVRLAPVQRLLARVASVVSVPALRRRIVELGTVATITATVAHAVPAGATPSPTELVLNLGAVDSQPSTPASAPRNGMPIDRGIALPTADTPPSEHVVRPGETLWGIIERHYGRHDPVLLRSVLDANPQITDPNLILVGWTITLPAAEISESVGTGAGRASPEATWSVVTVARGDTLWEMVDRHYGHATAELVWAVVDANPGLDDPNLIHIGQTITLPPAPGTTVGPTTPSIPPVGPTPFPAPLPTPTITPADTAEPPTVTALVPDAPAESVGLPIQPVGDEPTPAPDTSPPAGPSPAGSSPAVTIGTDTDDAHDRHLPSIAVVTGWGGGAALAAALSALATRRRRNRPADRTRLPRTRRGVQAAVALHETPNRSAAEFAAIALRELNRKIRHRHGEPSAMVRLVRVATDEIEIVWETPNPHLIAPWQTPDGGWSWTISTTAPILSSADGPSPYPGLVTIGRTASGDVLINLESCGAFSLAGQPDLVADTARGIATELANSIFADAPTVLIVGDAIAAAGFSTTARHVRADEAAGWLRDRRESATALLARQRFGTLSALRSQPKASDAHQPVIVIVDATSAVADVDELVALANGGLGAIVIAVGGEVATDWSLDLGRPFARLLPLGLSLEPLGLSVEFADTLESEVIESPDPDVDEFDLPQPEEPGLVGAPPPVASVIDEPEVVIATPVDDEALEDESAWDVELKVLGQVRAVGVKEPLTPTELHLAIYLAFHRNGENADTISCMIWPDGTTERNVVNTMTSLRRKLGVGSDGEMLFPLGRENQHTYRFSNRVVTDWDRFVALVKRAEAADPDLADRLYERAFSLINGPPFRATKGYSWAYEDGTTSSMLRLAETIQGARHGETSGLSRLRA